MLQTAGNNCIDEIFHICGKFTENDEIYLNISYSMLNTEYLSTHLQRHAAGFSAVLKRELAAHID